MNEYFYIEILNKMNNICSLQSFDLDLSMFERKLIEKQYQRCKFVNMFDVC